MAGVGTAVGEEGAEEIGDGAEGHGGDLGVVEGAGDGELNPHPLRLAAHCREIKFGRRAATRQD